MSYFNKDFIIFIFFSWWRDMLNSRTPLLPCTQWMIFEICKRKTFVSSLGLDADFITEMISVHWHFPRKGFSSFAKRFITLFFFYLFLFPNLSRSLPALCLKPRTFTFLLKERMMVQSNYIYFTPKCKNKFDQFHIFVLLVLGVTKEGVKKGWEWLITVSFTQSSRLI